MANKLLLLLLVVVLLLRSKSKAPEIDAHRGTHRVWMQSASTAGDRRMTDGFSSDHSATTNPGNKRSKSFKGKRATGNTQEMLTHLASIAWVQLNVFAAGSICHSRTSLSALPDLNAKRLVCGFAYKPCTQQHLVASIKTPW